MRNENVHQRNGTVGYAPLRPVADALGCPTPLALSQRLAASRPQDVMTALRAMSGQSELSIDLGEGLLRMQALYQILHEEMASAGGRPSIDRKAA